MATAFFSLSISSVALLFGLRPAVARSSQARLGLAFVAVWAVGILVAMAFPLNEVGMPETLSSAIHRASGPIAFISLTMGTMLLTKSFARDERWRSRYYPALTLALIMTVAFIATFVAFVVVPDAGFGGLSQRVFLVAIATWSVLTARHIGSALECEPLGR